MIFGRKKPKVSALPFTIQPAGAAMPGGEDAGEAHREAGGPFAASGDNDGRLKNYAIYYRDRELAQTKGDPLITIIQAYTQAEAQMEALKMQKEGCEILTIQSNEAVAHPTQETPAALPARRVGGPVMNKIGGAGSVFKAKHNLMRGF